MTFFKPGDRVLLTMRYATQYQPDGDMLPARREHDLLAQIGATGTVMELEPHGWQGWEYAPHSFVRWDPHCLDANDRDRFVLSECLALIVEPDWSDQDQVERWLTS